MRADRFLDTVYREYALYDLPEIQENAAEQRNLQSLYELARRYESGLFGGVTGFLQYIEELKKDVKEKMPEGAYIARSCADPDDRIVSNEKKHLNT